MTLTNKSRLPAAIVRAISNDEYTKNGADFSVTELLGPPQISRLRAQHAEALTEDAADRIWALLGSAVHAIIERAGAGDADTLSEVTLTTNVDGHTIKGTFDNLTISSAEMCDFKVTTVWKVVGGGVPPEWEAQTNIYRWMLYREKGIVINSIAIIAILRDWSKREADKRADYPQAQAVRLEVPLWDFADVERFVHERIALHTMNPPPACTDEDIWAKPSKWAVMKKGRQSAVKLCDSEADARAYMASNSVPGGYIEYRAGTATRCESYCPVSAFCQQWVNDPRNPKTTSITETLFNA